MRVPDPKANTTTEAYLAYKAGYLEENELKPSLYEPYLHFDAWLAYWAGLTNDYPTDKNGNPEMLTDEEALVAYLAGVTDTYPEDIKDPYDVRIVGYLRHLASIRWPEPDYPVNNEEFYLSTMEPTHTSNPVPSSNIELDTVEGKIISVEAYGNTYQQTYTGKNLLYTPDGSFLNNQVTWTSDNNSATASGTAGSSSYSALTGFLSKTIPAGTYTFSIKEPVSKRIQFACRKDSSSPQVTNLIPIGSTSVTFTLEEDMGEYHVVCLDAANADFTGFTISAMQLEAGNEATPFEPYVGGIASPNPDYPQEVLNVKHQNMVRLTGKNLVSANELYLVNVERTTDGLRKTITSSPLATYYSGSIANPVGVYTVSFDARITNPDVATLVFQQAGIWGDNNLRLKDENGDYADEAYRTLNEDWKRFSYTVNATVSNTWTLQRAIMLYFSTYQNSPVFELRNLQIEAGDTATSFDGSAPQMYPIDFRTGKNMLSLDFLSVGGLAASGNVYPDKKYQINNAFAPLKVNPTTTYSISANLGTTVMGMRVYVQECDVNTLPISGSWKQLASEPYTFITGSDTQYVKLGFSLSTTSATVTDETENTTPFDTVHEWLRGTTLQVEEGEPTVYEPYESIELCKIGDYQDYIYNDGDDWYLHKEVVKISPNGTESWMTTGTQPTGQFYVYTTDFDSIVKTKVYSGLVSDNFTMWRGNPSWITPTTVTNGAVFSNSDASDTAALRIMFPTSVASSVEDVKTWLASNLPVFYYPIATPTDTKITDATLVGQLDALANADTYNEKTYISVIANYPILPALLKVEAYKY